MTHRNFHRPTVLEVLFPKARASILRLLFTTPKKQRYVSELMRLSDVTLGTIQEELATLSAIGLIISRSTRYRHYYQANRDHPLFPHVLGIVHTAGRLAGIDVTNLRRIRRRHQKRRKKPQRAMYPLRPARPYSWGLFSDR